MIHKFRTFIQSISLLLLHSSFWPIVGTKAYCVPVLSCPSCALSWFACPVGVLAHFGDWATFPLLALGMLMLIAVLVGRLFCGWICPFGFLQDLLHKVPTKKYRLPDWTGYTKYAVLLGMVILVPLFLGVNSDLFFCNYCPAAAIQVTIPSLLGGGGFSAETALVLGILAAIVVLSIFTKRGFCKMLCPIGAFMAPFNLISFWRVKPPTENCISCRQCDRRCPAGISPFSNISRNRDPNLALDCIACHECQEVCPAKEPKKKKNSNTNDS